MKNFLYVEIARTRFKNLNYKYEPITLKYEIPTRISYILNTSEQIMNNQNMIKIFEECFNEICSMCKECNTHKFNIITMSCINDNNEVIHTTMLHKVNTKKNKYKYVSLIDWSKEEDKIYYKEELGCITQGEETN